jgi:ABC-type multidrug transport system fused ATPase/permease subunit
MYAPIKKLSRVNANLQQAAAASERIFEVLDVHTEVIERDGAVALPPFASEIEFKDVTFGYEDGHGRSTLRGVSFTVRTGQMIAIVGGAAPARPRSSTCCRASTTSRAGRSRSTAATFAT